MNETQLLVLAAAALLAFSIRSFIFHKWQDALWRELAQATGLAYHRRGFVGDPYLTGTYRHYTLTLDNLTGYSRRLREYVRVRVRLTNPAGIDFVLTEAGSNGPSPWKPGGERRLLDDPEFDQRLNLASRNAPQVAEYFPKAARQHWLRLGPFDLKVEANVLQLRRVGLEISPAEIVTILNVVTELAHVIDSLAPPSFPRH